MFDPRRRQKDLFLRPDLGYNRPPRRAAVKAGLLAIAKRRVSGLDGCGHGGKMHDKKADCCQLSAVFLAAR